MAEIYSSAILANPGFGDYFTDHTAVVMPIAQGQSSVSFSLTPGVVAQVDELLANV